MISKLEDIFKQGTEEYSDLLDFTSNIPLVSWMMNPNRPRVKDLKKDQSGKVIVDVTRPHILENMSYFTKAADTFKATGKYCPYYPSRSPNSPYRKFWDEEIRRCIEGYVREDGEWITGYYYYYLNYSPIMIVKRIEQNSKRSVRFSGFPDVWDGDYMFFHYVEQAEERGLHGAIIKARRRGYSFKLASMMQRNYFLIKQSKSYAFASNSEYLDADGILNKADDNFSFVNTHCGFGKKLALKDTLMHRISGYKKAGDSTEYGFKSERIGVTTKNEPGKVRGKSGKLMAYEEAGSNPNLVQSWSISLDSVRQGGNVFGLMIAFGTGGDKSSNFQGLESLFYEGGGYEVYVIRNVFDKNSDRNTCGLFIPDYLNRSNCYDNNGNSDVVKAIGEVIEIRRTIQRSSSDTQYLTRRRAEVPCIVGDTLISNISIGSNKILFYDSKFENGYKDVYQLETIGGRKLNCTAEHEIFNGNDYIPATNYKPKDVIKLKPLIPNNEYKSITIKGQFNFDTYNLIIDEDWARFIGLYLGDGSFYNSTIEISFDERDESSLKWTKNFCESKFGHCVIKKHTRKQMKSILINSIFLKHLLLQLDLIEKWNGNKHGYKRKIDTPLYIMQSPKSVIANYLKGYFDSDSGIYKSQKNIKIFCKFKVQLEKIQILLSAFDIYCTIKSEKKINREGREFTGNSITLRSWEVDRFKEIGYISNYKQELLDKWLLYTSKTPINYDLDIFKSLTYLGKDYVYDIETEEGCYSANGIWVHNCTPQEAVMRIQGSEFPVGELKDYLSEISPSKEQFVAKHFVVELKWVHSDLVEFKPIFDKKPIRDYPYNGNDITGAVEIFELPVKEPGNNKPIWGRYVVGVDPVDDDTTKTHNISLMSVWVFDLWNDVIAAEWTGRYPNADDNFEIALKLSILYNAQINYENKQKGLYDYFNRKNKLKYLMTTPSLLKDMDYIKDKNLIGNRSFGTPPNKEINAFARKKIADWMRLENKNRPNISEGKDGEEIITYPVGLQTIRSFGLIKEAIAWNLDGNFDRISGLGMVFIARSDRAKIVESSTRNVEEVDELANDDFIKNNYRPNALIKSTFDF